MLEAATAEAARNPNQISHSAGFAAATLIAVCCLSAAFAQSPAPASPSSNAPSSNAPKPTVQQLPHVTTTVVVHSDDEENYLPENVTLGVLNGEALKDAPLSATVVTRAVLNDQVSRLLSDVVKNDASVADDYVPVGYYGNYEIRGFPIDLATGIEVDGMTIAGEQDVPLENKESVEFLKGLTGVESGVAAGGGLIDFMTKPPALVKDIDLATDQRGSAYGAVDLGRFFGSRKQVGARLNLAGERIVPYMNDTNGWRGMGAGAADWKLTPKTALKGSFEYQHKTERDGSGYQLLGGTTVPDIQQVYPSTMLGDQPWGLPDTYDTFNTNARLDHSFSPSWLAFAAASYSHSLIQDNVIYAYGAPFDANGNVDCPGAPDAPEYFFCPAVPSINYSGGDYGIYDYRNPGELRIDAVAEAMLTGHIKTGRIKHDVAFGGELFLRSVQQPGFFTYDNPASADGVDGAVYQYLGSENIYQSMIPYGPAMDSSGSLLQAGPRRLWEDSRQSSAVIQDRIHLPGRVQLIAGGRFDSLRDHNYSLAATTPCTQSAAPGPENNPCPTGDVPTLPNLTDKTIWMPQYAITFNPIGNLTLYSNYGVMLALGPEAPWWAADASQFLAPFFTRQAEIGAKYAPGQRILLSTALFHMRAPFFYPKLVNSVSNEFENTYCGGTVGEFCFEQDGHETHDGIELNAQGKAASWLRLTASAMALRATSSDTGTPSFDNKQVINVPRVRTTLFADIALPHMRGLYLMPGWNYAGRNAATRDDAVSVPSYNLFNLGARYKPGGEQGRVTLRIYADNIVNKRYWSDTGASYGDTFLWLGAPTTVRLSAHYTF